MKLPRKRCVPAAGAPTFPLLSLRGRRPSVGRAADGRAGEVKGWRWCCWALYFEINIVLIFLISNEVLYYRYRKKTTGEENKNAYGNVYFEITLLDIC